jgi:hypothetical protein
MVSKQTFTSAGNDFEIPMVMGRFLIDIYPISPFTSIREEQGLNMLYFEGLLLF